MAISRTHAPLRRDTVIFLRNAIIEGRFKPNQRLIERELCDLAGVSRTTIREALRQLEAEGFVKNISNKGPIVAPITRKEVEDTYQVREGLEALATRIFAERASDSEIEALANSIQQFRNACSNRSQKEMIQAKNEFYEILLQGCKNNLIITILHNLYHRITFLRLATLSYPGRYPESLEEVEAILDGIKKRDPDAAWSACVKHIMKAKAVALKIVDQTTEFASNEGDNKGNTNVDFGFNDFSSEHNTIRE
jgi:DNA-binding GntR family transcriptional regulator